MRKRYSIACSLAAIGLATVLSSGSFMVALGAQASEGNESMGKAPGNDHDDDDDGRGDQHRPQH